MIEKTAGTENGGITREGLALGNHALIDGNSLIKGTRKMGLDIDLLPFRKYLQDKYDVEKPSFSWDI